MVRLEPGNSERRIRGNYKMGNENKLQLKFAVVVVFFNQEIFFSEFFSYIYSFPYSLFHLFIFLKNNHHWWIQWRLVGGRVHKSETRVVWLRCFTRSVSYENLSRSCLII